MPLPTSSFTRTLGSTVGDAVNICFTEGTQGVAYGVQMSVVEPSASLTRDRVYRAEVKVTGNPVGWRRLVPYDKTEKGTTWGVDVSVDGRTATFRLVRVQAQAGGAGPTTLNCKVIGYSAPGGSVTITGSQSILSNVVNVGVYEGALITQVDGNVGIGTESPSATLDVAGSVRISGNVNMQGLGASVTENAVYVDVATGKLSFGQVASGGNSSFATSDQLSDISVFHPGLIDTLDVVPVSLFPYRWKSRTSAADNLWNSVTWGNGLFVAVAGTGTGNRVMTSSDGITWTIRTSAADNLWNSVTWGNGLFVAVAGTGTGNRVMTSSDGITWTIRTSAADNSWNSVTWGNGLFVAVAGTGTGNRVMTSPDGITWTIRTSAADVNWLSVTWGNGLFVAMGTGSIMTSPDAITWTSRSSPGGNWFEVVYANNLFVAVASGITGFTGITMTSLDGITWTRRTSASDNGWNSVTWGNGLFVAVAGSANSGLGNRVMTWDPSTLPPSPNVSGVLYYSQDSGLVSYGPLVVNATSNVLGFLTVTNTANVNSVTANVLTVGGNTIANIARTAVVSQTISDNVTTTAPSENAVFDALALKENAITAATTSTYYRGDKTFQTLNTSAVAEGTNLYYTDARAQAALVTQLAAKENLIAASTNTTYFRGDKTFQTLNTSAVAEGTNLYYTDARAQAALVTQLATKANVTNATISGTLSVSGNATIGNLSTNTISATAASVSTLAVGGTSLSTLLAAKENAIASSTNTTYFRGDKSFQTLNTSAVAEGTNLYYTDARAQAALVTQLASKANVANASFTGTANISGALSVSGNVFLSNVPVNATGNAIYIDPTTGLVSRGPGFLTLSTLTATETSSGNVAAPWVSRTSAADLSWRSVTWGNGLYVAVAESGASNRVMTSPDSVTWTSRTSAADNNWHSVTYANRLFVAVAYSGIGNRVMTSPDGITWTSRTSSADNQWLSVTWGAGLFVAVAASGTGNRVMTSPDGITWTARQSAADNEWTSVTYGNGLFVAVARTGTGNRVMTSPDGITWTIRTSAEDNGYNSVTYGNALFVAVAGAGTNNRVMTSPDGITWTSRATATVEGWRSVTFGFGLFVAVATTGNFQTIMTSPNGITWTIRTAPVVTVWYGVTYGNGIFVAVAGDLGTGNRVMTMNYVTTTTAISNSLQLNSDVAFVSNVSASSVSVTGNVVAGIVSATSISGTGNVSAGNLSTNAISATSASVSSLTVGGTNLNTLLSAKENTITASNTATYFRGDKTFQTLNTTAVLEGANLYYTDARAQAALVTQLSAKENTITASNTATYFRGDKTFQTLNTTAVPEGANLYYTDARAQAALVTQLATKANVTNATISGTLSVSGNATIGNLSTNTISATSASVSTLAVGGTSLSTLLAAKENAIASSTNTTYFRGDKTFQTLNTSAVAEGTNLYYTDARAQAALVTQLSAKENTITASNTATYFRGDKTFQTLNTTAVPEGANLYYTDARAQAALVTQLSAKENTITASNTATYFRGDKTFQTLNTTAVPEGANLYYTNARAQAALVTQLSAKENTITASTTSTYYRGDKTFQTLNTNVVPEGSNLYYTDARAQAALVTQLSAKADVNSPTFTGTLSVPNINATGNISCAALDVQRAIRFAYYQRSLGTNVGNAIEFCGIIANGGSYVVDISVVQNAPTASIAKSYRVSISSMSTMETWRRLLPISSSSDTSWGVEVNTTSLWTWFRIIRTSSGGDSTAFHVHVTASSTFGFGITESNVSYTSATTNGIYQNTLLTCANNRIGLRTETPSADVHVSGDTLISGNLSVSGNTQIGNVSTGRLTADNVSANAITGTNLTGTLQTAAQPNVTSLGTLASLNVTGDVAAGNVSTNVVSATAISGTQLQISGQVVNFPGLSLGTSTGNVVAFDPATGRLSYGTFSAIANNLNDYVINTTQSSSTTSTTPTNYLTSNFLAAGTYYVIAIFRNSGTGGATMRHRIRVNTVGGAILEDFGEYSIQLTGVLYSVSIAAVTSISASGGTISSQFYRGNLTGTAMVMSGSLTCIRLSA